MKKSHIIGIVAAAVVAMGTWFWASPSLAMNGLRNAVLEGDKAELAERVDFPAIKESLKSQFKAYMMAEMAKEKDNPFAGLGMMVANAMIDPMIDGMVSPDGLKVLAKNGSIKRGPDDAGEAKEVEWEIDRDGFDRFTASPKVPDQDRTKLVFTRQGMGWKLVDIEVPSPPAQSPASGEAAAPEQGIDDAPPLTQ